MSAGLQTAKEVERELLLEFIERNVRIAPPDLDEGLGTVYERVVLDDYFRTIQRRYGIRSVLETPADGVTGVPGLNSVEFARNGADVTLANPSLLMLEKAAAVWQARGFSAKLTTVQAEPESLNPSLGAFDLVWNYCMFERFANPAGLLDEMSRFSRRYVMILTQNRKNFGTPIHIIYHQAHRLRWDHGQLNQMSMDAICQAMQAAGLQIRESGTVDIPPWLDTWDMPLRGVLKSSLSAVGLNWDWSLKPGQASSEPGALVRLTRWVEHNLPDWFKASQAHHFYVLAEKVQG